MRSRGIVAVEMEAAALFYLAMREPGGATTSAAACILTVSDTLGEGRRVVRRRLTCRSKSSRRRRKRMIEIALEAGTAEPRRAMIPIGINLTSIGVTSAWWLESAELVEQAGFAGVWCWDHFISARQEADPGARVLDDADRRGRAHLAPQGRQLRRPTS